MCSNFFQYNFRLQGALTLAERNHFIFSGWSVGFWQLLSAAEQSSFTVTVISQYIVTNNTAKSDTKKRDLILTSE